MYNPAVTFSDDGTMWVNWSTVLFSFGEEGFGYAIRVGDKYHAGKFATWPEAVQEILAALAAEKQ